MIGQALGAGRTDGPSVLRAFPLSLPRTPHALPLLGVPPRESARKCAPGRIVGALQDRPSARSRGLFFHLTRHVCLVATHAAHPPGRSILTVTMQVLDSPTGWTRLSSVVHGLRSIGSRYGYSVTQLARLGYVLAPGIVSTPRATPDLLLIQAIGHRPWGWMVGVQTE